MWMSDFNLAEHEPRCLKRRAWGLAVGWTVAVAALLIWNEGLQRRTLGQVTVTQSRAVQRDDPIRSRLSTGLEAVDAADDSAPHPSLWRNGSASSSVQRGVKSAVSTAPAVPTESTAAMVFGHCLLWLLGLVVIATVARKAVRKTRELAGAKTLLDNVFVHPGNDATIVIDVDSRILLCNPQAEEFLGLPNEGIVGRSIRSIRQEGKTDPESLGRALYAIHESGVYECEIHDTDPGGRDRSVHVVATALLNDEKEPCGYVLRWRDITRDVTREEMLAAELREARATVDSMSESLANVSHEIRTPMVSILGFTETLLEDHESEPDKLTTVSTIHRNGQYLLRLVNDILDVSKIQAGQMRIERTRCAPWQIVTDVVSLMRVQADAKGITLDVECAGGIPDTIGTDPTRLRQILINLIGNAVKFTDVGGVRLVLRIADAGSNDDTPSSEPMLQFDIVDSGVGISREQTSQLFQPYVQSSPSTARTHGGTGLGLAISRRLAKLLGGDLTFESEFGKGSTFHLTISTGPLDGVKTFEQFGAFASGEPDATTPRPTEQACLTARILLVEDDPDSRRLISMMLERVGAEVATAEDGRQAVDRLLASPRENESVCEAHPVFDVVLMDMQMPVMNGYEAVRTLRQKGYTEPIIALTANTAENNRRKCIEAGCDDHAVKPIRQDELVRIITRHLKPPRRPSITPQSLPDTVPQESELCS